MACTPGFIASSSLKPEPRVVRGIERLWYRKDWISKLLLPAAWLYGATMALRRYAYRLGLRRVTRVAAPVIIVGNITVGGTGKTPLVIWLAQFLSASGYHPGVMTRGYGGRARDWPRTVAADSDPDEVGEEPVLLARRAGCPVVADPKRARAAQRLIDAHGCDVLLSDDGLQHLALARDIEIAVIDGRRRFGNGYCLPAGPLREPPSRLRDVDAMVTQGEALTGEWRMTLVERGFVRVGAGEPPKSLDAFRGRTVHAVAGIGDPQRFFEHLTRLGVRPIEHPFPDHHYFRPEDIYFNDDYDVLMTEKDAVKCERFEPGRAWYLAVDAEPDPRFGAWLLQRLKEITRG